MIDSYRMVVINLIASVSLLFGILIYKFIYPKKNINLLFLLILISLLPVLSILRKGTYESSDLTLHTHYAMSFYENLKVGNLFPQWTNVGYGTPVFIFLYPLPFYLASFFHFLGVSFLNSMKLVLIVSYLSSGIAMYYWAKEEFGKISSFLASLMYLFAPFHLVDMHFRASVGETLSFVFIPLVFLYSKKLIEVKKYKFLILGAISFALLMLSHLATALITFHLVTIYIFIIWVKKKNKKRINLIYWSGSIFLGLLLSAFYWIPARFEVKYTLYSFTLPTGGFLSLKELLYSPTMFGLLFQGHHGETHYLVGYTQLLVFIISIILINKIHNKRNRALLLFFQISFLILFFMTLTISQKIWETFSYLNNFQFAWRLLVPIAFILSAIAAIVTKKLNKKIVFIICVFTVLSTILNWENRKMVPEQKENYAGYETLYTEYYDPLNPLYKKIYPNLNNVIKKDIPKLPIETIKGQAEIKQTYRNPTQHEYIIYAKTDVTIKENTLYFPNWRLLINNSPYPINFKDLRYMGVITFKLNPGIYKAELKFQNTKIRTISQNITIIALLFIFFYSLIMGYKKINIKLFRKYKRLLNQT